MRLPLQWEYQVREKGICRVLPKAAFFFFSSMVILHRRAGAGKPQALVLRNSRVEVKAVSPRTQVIVPKYFVPIVVGSSPAARR